MPLAIFNKDILKYILSKLLQVPLVPNSADRDSINRIYLRTTEIFRKFALLLIFGQFKSEHQVYSRANEYNLFQKTLCIRTAAISISWFKILFLFENSEFIIRFGEHETYWIYYWFAHSGRSYYIDLLLIKLAVLAMFQEIWSQIKNPSRNWQQFPKHGRWQFPNLFLKR